MGADYDLSQGHGRAWRRCSLWRCRWRKFQQNSALQRQQEVADYSLRIGLLLGGRGPQRAVAMEGVVGRRQLRRLRRYWCGRRRCVRPQLGHHRRRRRVEAYGLGA